MDHRGGVLNFEGVQILRHCETKGKRFVRNTVIASTAALQRAASVVQQYGQMRFPTLHQYVDGIGENICFRPLDVIEAAVRSAGLEDAAKRRRIQVAESLDGANFSKHLNFVMFGIKNQDLFARNPELGELVLATNIQSASNVWPVDIIMGKEGTNLIPNPLQELFVRFEHAASTGLVDKYDWMPIQDATNADMNAVWQRNKFGCATKTRGNAKPCHCCLINNDDLVLPNEDKTTCRWCTSSGAAMDSSRRCYHHRIVTEQVAASMEVKLSSLEEIFNGMLAEVDVFQRESLILTTENPKVPTAVARNDASSIHFVIDRSTPWSIVSEYNSKIVHDLEIRGMDSSGGNLEERCKKLQTRLVKEWAYVRLKPNVEENRQRAAKALFLIMKTVPCILHAENRIGIKVLTMLLIEGLSNALKLATNGERAASKEFVDKIERLVNTQVFRDKMHEAQWQMPLTEDKKQIGTICMSNVRTQKIIGFMESLVDICVVNHKQKDLWIECICNNYRDMLSLLTLHRNLSPSKINRFQTKADGFFDKWVRLHGVAGITNYIHMIGSGHFVEYWEEWGNLYQHSQKGWEAFNNLIKIFNYRRTQRGRRSKDGKKT